MIVTLGAIGGHGHACGLTGFPIVDKDVTDAVCIPTHKVTGCGVESYIPPVCRDGRLPGLIVSLGSVRCNRHARSASKTNNLDGLKACFGACERKKGSYRITNKIIRCATVKRESGTSYGLVRSRILRRG